MCTVTYRKVNFTRKQYCVTCRTVWTSLAYVRSRLLKSSLDMKMYDYCLIGVHVAYKLPQVMLHYNEASNTYHPISWISDHVHVASSGYVIVCHLLIFQTTSFVSGNTCICTPATATFFYIEQKVQTSRVQPKCQIGVQDITSASHFTSASKSLFFHEQTHERPRCGDGRART